MIVNIDEIQGFKKDGKSKEIIEDLLKQIEESKIKIGDKLPSERILAKQYNVSRIVIREVVSYLKAINVVESIQGSGNFVRNYPKNSSFEITLPNYDIDDLIESRKIIEKAIASLVIKNSDQLLIDKIEEILFEFKRSIQSKDLNGVLEQDYNFHQIYAQYSKNSVIENFLNYLTNFMHEKYWKVLKEDYLFTNTYNKKTLENHKNIFKALKEKDLDKLLFFIELHYKTIIVGLKK